MDRARVLPSPWVRHVEVDASSGRLWYYEAGKQVGTMRVVVGAKETQTPMLVGALTWAIVNPYWNVPPYLARGSIAKKENGRPSCRERVCLYVYNLVVAVLLKKTIHIMCHPFSKRS